MMHARSLIAAVSVVVALAGGCAVPPVAPQERVFAPLPARYDAPVAAGVGQDTLDAEWWRAFGSEELDDMLARVRAQNLDLAAAGARVRQAEAAARAASAGLWPQVSAAVDAGREGRLAGHGDAASGSRYAATLTTTYEADLWGGRQAAQRGAGAVLQASVFDRDTVRLTLTAGAAIRWLDAVALQARIGIARLNVRDAEQLLALVQARVRAGAALPLDAAQQRTLLAAQRRALAALQQAGAQARVTLDIWLGEAGAGDAAVRTQSLAALREPVIGAGVPSQLLVRRPDIARAEAQLAAADADVLVARAAMLPRLTLSAGAGVSAGKPGTLLDAPAYSVAAGLLAPIFSAGRLAAGHDLALARREELLADYRASIVAAFGDVRGALHALDGLHAQRAAQADELAQAKQALALARARYRAGGETLLALLDAQRSVYAAQDMAVQLDAARLQAAVALYKALGGGWRGAADGPADARASGR
jgi:outer membrane protein, multidrug efflux system